MAEAWRVGHINCWSATNCFSDCYTCGKLDLAQRKIIMFHFLLVQGGCEL